MKYLTYAEFTVSGGVLDEATFNRLEFKARTLINLLTHNRLIGEQPIRESVKMAMHDVIVSEARNGVYDGREIASVSNDGVSVVYATAAPGGARERLITTICEYLANETVGDGVPVLYAGVDA